MTIEGLETDLQKLRIAILNPWFLAGGGGSKVVSVLASMLPNANIFTLFYKQEMVPGNLRNKTLHTSFLHRVPFIHRIYRLLLPLHPLAVESLDMRGYDIVISCDASVMKGALVDQNALHLCYCHTPTRYVWDLHRTFAEHASFFTTPIFWLTSHYLRLWDFSAAQRVDYFIANSHYVAQRIHAYYRRKSTVIYPPVNTATGYIADDRGDYYLSVGRLAYSKRLDLVVKACNRLKRRLIIVGTGREEAHLKAMAGSTIEFAGRVSDDDLPALYANCRAFVFAADEDFGIAPVEAQSFGIPVIAYGHGGVLETVLTGEPEDATGVFFPRQTVESVVKGILDFEVIQERFNSALIRVQAQRFDTAVFVSAMRKYIQDAYAARNKKGYDE